MNPYARMAKFDGTKQHRRSLLAKVHVAKKALGLNDDDYRAVLIRVTGHDSAAMLNEVQLALVVEEFGRKGFDGKPAKRPGRPAAADHPSARKARALWISLHQLGAIANASEPALEAFAARQLKVDRLQWVDQAQCYKLVEALKAMAQRAGWNQDLSGVKPDARVIVLKRRLVDALLVKLVAAGTVPADWSVDRAAYSLGGIEGVRMLFATTAELDVVAKTFAAKLRTPIAPIAPGEIT